MRVLIVGCGYVGIELGRQLAAAGHGVSGMRRSGSADAALRAAGITPVAGDITRVADLLPLRGRFDWVVDCVSSSHGDAGDYRAVYRDGMRNLVEAFAGTGLRALVYTSSTGVYGQGDGGWVDEDSATEPSAETSRVLVEAERVLLGAAGPGFPARVLRVAGIYGPGRGHLFRQFLRGEARMSAADRWMNMVHRDDVAGAVRVVLERGEPGGVYNAVDDEPVTQGDFLRWLASRTGLPVPPAGEPQAAGKRGDTNKRISNRRLRQGLGWVPAYPTFREGYAAMLQAG